jgi:hypothetical protein
MIHEKACIDAYINSFTYSGRRAVHTNTNTKAD